MIIDVPPMKIAVQNTASSRKHYVGCVCVREREREREGERERGRERGREGGRGSVCVWNLVGD